MIKLLTTIHQNLLIKRRNGHNSKYFIVISIVILLHSCEHNNRNIPIVERPTSPVVKKEMWEEPRHQLILTKGDIRVIDVRIPPKDTTEYHAHNSATLYNLISDVNVVTQEYGEKWVFKSEKKYRKSGTFLNLSKTYIQNNSYHRVANIDTATFHLIGIVNTKINNKQEEEEYDAWFIRHQVDVDKRSSIESHKFNNPVLIIQNTNGESAIIQENILHSFKSEAGAVTWIPANVQFKLGNDSETTINYNIIELKDLNNQQANEQ